MTGLRIGHGFDVHGFQAGDHLILGGVRIPYQQSFAAHSDGDVLIHALCDAILGALALGDIGRHFPDTDPQFKGIDSRELLKQVAEKMQQLGYTPVNLDITIIAQQPRMAEHIEAMRNNLAQDLATELGAINIKATTTEKLGYLGRAEGVAVHAVVLLENQ